MITQGDLGFWSSNDYVTYSEIEQYRNQTYPRQGPKLIRECAECISLLEEEFDWPEALRVLNDNSALLGALNPLWSGFSVEVFKFCLDPTPTSPKALRNSFEDTTKRLAKAA